jgi:thiol-disulfide isomerase/thioredoxin
MSSLHATTIILSVELYAPWCGHCQTIKPIYDQVAHHFHESREHRVKVGKIDGDSEKALMSRFGAKGYPSFYLLDGYTVHEYQGDRSFEAMVAFTESDYLKQSPVAFYKSPMGPVGLMQGFFLVGIYGAFDIFAWLQGALGLSPMFAAMVIFGSLFFGCFVSIVVVAIALTPREKQD